MVRSTTQLFLQLQEQNTIGELEISIMIENMVQSYSFYIHRIKLAFKHEILDNKLTLINFINFYFCSQLKTKLFCKHCKHFLDIFSVTAFFYTFHCSARLTIHVMYIVQLHDYMLTKQYRNNTKPQ